MKKTTILLFTICVIASFYYPSEAALFQSSASGNWSDPGVWEVWTGSWSPASAPPGIEDVVTIRAGNTIDITVSDAAAARLVIESGAVLSLRSAILALRLDNGDAGADLIVEGTFEDHAGSGAGNGLRFENGATWQLAAGGTIVKTSNSSAATYRDNYEGDMSNIPATANWIIRHTGSGSPGFSTNNTFYPNLTFESTSGAWNPPSGFSRFQGASASAVIKGDLDIGGNGPGTVTIYNENRYSSPILIEGHCIVRSGSTFTNNGTSAGTGLEVRGNITVSGDLYLTAGNGILKMSGGAPQQISGQGTLQIHTLQVNNDVQLQRNLEVQNELILTSGNIVLQQSDLTVAGTISGGSVSSYIRTMATGSQAGGLIVNSPAGELLPVGRESYNPISLIAAGSGSVKVRVEDLVKSDGYTGEVLQERVVSRSWYVEGAGNNWLDVNLHWQAGQERPQFDRSLCYVSRYAGQGWEASEPGPASGSTFYVRNLSGAVNAGIFSVASGSVLPVELTFFNAEYFENKVVLKWQTATEVNNDYFAIERSSDGKRFLQIGRVAGKGQSREHSDYSFTDLSPPPGLLYYRLVQVDTDGKQTLSPIRAVSLTGQQQNLLVSANPVVDKINLQWKKPLSYPAQLTIFDLTGRLVFGTRLTAGQRDYTIEISTLPKGIYILTTGDGRQDYVVRLVKK